MLVTGGEQAVTASSHGYAWVIAFGLVRYVYGAAEAK